MHGKASLKYSIHWLFEQYKNIVRLYARKYPFKIIDIEQHDGGGETQFVIKIEYRISTIKKTAHELVAHPDFLEGFSRSDVQIITYHFFINNQKPQYELIGEKRAVNGTALLLKDNKCSVTHVKNVSDFRGIKKYISKLNPKSAFRIGFLMGTNSKRKYHAKTSR